jgi:hypothetical protein
MNLKMFAASTLLSLGLAWSNASQAAGFQAKTMRDTLSAREVERGLVLGKGWVEFALGADVKLADGSWDADGNPVDWENTTWLYTTERIALRYGIARRGEMYWMMRAHHTQLTNDELGTDISYTGIGDPHFGYKWEAFRSLAPVRSWIVFIDYKAPMGNEAPGNYIGGPTTWSSVITTTGTPDITVGTRAKGQYGPLALEAGVARKVRMSGITQYAIETTYSQFQGRVKPGNEIIVDAILMVQAGPVAISGGAVMTQRDAFKVGNTTTGFFPGSELEAIEGTDGVAVDGNFGATFNVTRGFDVVAGMSVPLQGEDLDFFPLEDVHPTRGTTYSGTLEFRY